MWKYWADELRETDFCHWFQTTYLSEPWCNWFVTASGVPGVLPNQNPQEVAHRVMKQTSDGKLHSSMEYCVKTTIPSMMTNFRESTNHSYVAEKGPLPTEMIVKAYQRSSLKRCQLQKVNEVVNGTLYYGYVVKSSRAAEPSITKVMAKDFLHLMEGNEARRNPPSFESFFSKTTYKCYFVEVNEDAEFEGGFQYKPTYTKDEMKGYRGWVVCGCKSYFVSGWVCSHVLQVYEQMGFDLKEATSNLAPNCQRGRPRKMNRTYRYELQSPEYFTVNPGKAVGREVQVLYEVDGRPVTLFGHVVGFEIKKEEPYWIIKYRDDGTQESLCIYELMKYLVLG